MLGWDPGATERLTGAFVGYERQFIDDGHTLLCSSASDCGASVGNGTFAAGQLSWVGSRYGLVHQSGRTLRILVVPKQTGRGGEGHSHVTHAGRSAQVSEAKVGRIGGQRTHHMAGTEAALEVLLQAKSGTRHVRVAGVGRCHVFDCFAMVNATRCSQLKSQGTDGEGSRTMYRRCARHLSAAIDLLEPTIIVCQGRSEPVSPATSVRSAVSVLKQLDSHVYLARRDGRAFVVVELTHPSRNWVSYKDTRFNTQIRPVLEAAQEALADLDP